METIKKEIINKTYVETYVATDGTEFDDKEQCLRYEKSALGVLKGRLAKFTLKTGSECDLFGGCGCDENNAHVVVPKTEDEVKVVQQIMYHCAYGEWKQKNADRVAIGKVLVVIFSYDGDDAWLVDLGDVVSNATDGKWSVVENK